MALLIVFLLLVIVALLAYALHLARGEKRLIGRRIQQYAATFEEAREDRVNVYLRGVQRLVRLLAEKLKALPQAGWFEARLERSGIPLYGAEFMAVIIIAMVLVYLLVWPFVGFWWGRGGCALAAAALCVFYLEYRIRTRREMFHRQLGDVLLMMANAMRSGFSFLQAVEIVSQDMKPPVSEEFGRMMHEVRLGVSTEEALENLSRRVESDDLDLIITAVLIQRQVGGNLAQIFDTISATINDRLRMRREINTITAQGRLSGWVLGLMPVGLAFLMVIVNPDYLESVRHSEIGRIALIIGLISEIIGLLFIRKIVNIKP